MEQRIIVCGSRYWNDPEPIDKYLTWASHYYGNLTVVHGGATGADTIVKELCFFYGIDQSEYKAEWKRFGKKAGPIRNQLMLNSGKISFVMGFLLKECENRGTLNMLDLAKRNRIPTGNIKGILRTPTNWERCRSLV